MAGWALGPLPKPSMKQAACLKCNPAAARMQPMREDECVSWRSEAQQGLYEGSSRLLSYFGIQTGPHKTFGPGDFNEASCTPKGPTP